MWARPSSSINKRMPARLAQPARRDWWSPWSTFPWYATKPECDRQPELMAGRGLRQMWPMVGSSSSLLLNRRHLAGKMAARTEQLCPKLLRHAVLPMAMREMQTPIRFAGIGRQALRPPQDQCQSSRFSTWWIDHWSLDTWFAALCKSEATSLEQKGGGAR